MMKIQVSFLLKEMTLFWMTVQQQETASLVLAFATDSGKLSDSLSNSSALELLLYSTLVK